MLTRPAVPQTRQGGFTLIELVVVIIILGILAALAIPRFINLQTEARVAVIDGTQQSLRSAVTMVLARSAAAGQSGLQNQTLTIEAGPPAVTTVTDFGYPEAESADISPVLDGLSSRISFSGGGAAPNSVLTLRIDGLANCEVQYRSPAAAGSNAQITTVKTGC